MGQNEPRPEAEYHCSQAELYAGLDIAWDSQGEHEAEFANENTKYTAGLWVLRKQAIQAARKLPDGQARGAEAEDLRVTLEENHDEVIGFWNSLDGYIKKAFKGKHYKPRIEEAGKKYYDTAYRKDWEDVVLLLQSGKNFIDKHLAALTNKGGMPGNFEADYETNRGDFGVSYGKFKDAQQDSQEQTDVKIMANNAVYKEGREMMEDGKHIFRKNASVRDRFIWERILELVSTPGAALTGELTASPSSILAGESSTLSWSIKGSLSQSIDNGIGEVGAAGTRVVTPGVTTTYILTATAGQKGGTLTLQTTVSVSATPA